MTWPRLDLAGQVFGHWTVLGLGPPARSKRLWSCMCSCGTAKMLDGSRLKSGGSLSCGCLQATNGGGRGAHPREFESWSGARDRCHNPRAARYSDYGGRGITMCPEWRHDFPCFVADMGPRPIGMSLDRKNNDGPYASWNCRWATPLQQSRNSRKTRQITFNSETHCLSEWAERLGFDYDVVKRRLLKGWDVERAMTQPTRPLVRSKTRAGRP